MFVVCGPTVVVVGRAGWDIFGANGLGLSKICSPKGNCWRNHGLHFLIYCLGQMGLLVGRGAGTTNCNKGMDIMIKIPEII